jgi:hypothetical protein
VRGPKVRPSTSSGRPEALEGRRSEGPLRRLTAGLLLVCTVVTVLAQTQPLPTRLDDAAFWKIVTEFSELGGAFHSDNFTSNEPGFADASATLAAGRHGGAYLGVGPEQNFSYIVAIRPEIAFIVDIRRQALMQHLLFKALFELSRDRVDFIARLFSRPRPAGLEKATIQEVWDAFAKGPTGDRALYKRNVAAVEAHLTKTHGFTLTSDELGSLEYVYNAFFSLGPAINYAGYQEKLTTGNTDFAKLSMTADSAGTLRSFLATDENFAVVKSMQERNLIVPLQGDFAGPKTIRAIGDYLRGHDTTVTLFYISNVEQYLFGASVAKETDINGGWKLFYQNLAALPIDKTSALLRTPQAPPSPGRATTLVTRNPLCPIAQFLAAVEAGRVTTQAQATQCPG